MTTATVTEIKLNSQKLSKDILMEGFCIKCMNPSKEFFCSNCITDDSAREILNTTFNEMAQNRKGVNRTGYKVNAKVLWQEIAMMPVLGQLRPFKGSSENDDRLWSKINLEKGFLHTTWFGIKKTEKKPAPIPALIQLKEKENGVKYLTVTKLPENVIASAKFSLGKKRYLNMSQENISFVSDGTVKSSGKIGFVTNPEFAKK